MNRRRCYVVGDDVLTWRCLDILLNSEWHVSAVITSSATVADKATDAGVAVLDIDGVLAGDVALPPVDELFSIANLRVLPTHVLQAARGLAINFHDGPLPERAGLHVTSWAIADGETEHAVTWHLMEAEVDTGAVLVREPVPIDATDTAFSLNTACLDAGVRSFEQLIEELSADNVSPSPQPRTPDVVHSRWQRPEAAALLDWRRPTAELVNLSRALDFGPAHANPLGRPKLIMAGSVFVCPRLDPVPPGLASTQATPAPAPGTILAIDGPRLQVATGDGAVELDQLEPLDPTEPPATASAVAAGLGLTPGDQLGLLDEDVAAAITARHRATARHEQLWAERLVAMSPLNLPAVDAGANETAPRRRITDAHVNATVAPLVDHHGPAGIAAAVALFMARLTSEHHLTFGLAVDVPPGLDGLFAPTVPWTVAIDPAEPAPDQLPQLVDHLRATRSCDTYLLDLWQREPMLRGTEAPVEPTVVISLDTAATPASTAPVVIAISAEGTVALDVNERAISAADTQRLLDQFAACCTALIGGTTSARVGELPILTPTERELTLGHWNDTAAPLEPLTVVDLLRRGVETTPGAVAIVEGDIEFTYAELWDRAARVARTLQRAGVGPSHVVGLHLDRSADLVTAVIGTLVAGAAYLPLDPSYPSDRLAFMSADSGASTIITDRPTETANLASDSTDAVLTIDDVLADDHDTDHASAPMSATPSDLAYLIYTSGSTGLPKGVMVEHRNVVSFFAAMDERVPHEAGDVWLAVTSLSFDISVLELLWTLTRGLTVVIQPTVAPSRHPTEATRSPAPSPSPSLTSPAFSLFYFSADEGEDPDDRYRLLIEGARFADTHGFAAVWTPERHFHDFGGLYPNPSVTGAALAMITERVDIRAGSVVAPLHPPARIAEEWAVVDNLSKGRTGVAFASGWMPEDFVLRPHAFADNKAATYEHLDIVRRLWRGDAVELPGPHGEPVEVRTRPRPISDELAAWITTAGNPASYDAAATAGAGVLTHLLGQTIDELATNIARYRATWEATQGSTGGHVVVMVHTFVGADHESALDQARGPLKEYLRTATDLFARHSASFPTFANQGPGADMVNFADLDEDDFNAVLDHATDRYMETSGLIGDPRSTQAMIEHLHDIGVDEVACLVDFGIPTTSVLSGLEHLDQLRRNSSPTTAAVAPGMGQGLADIIERHGVTHLQCTPTLARLLLVDDDTTAALGRLRAMLVGGEACPAELAHELVACVDGPVLNMYGPTETTIWSTTQRLDTEPIDGPVPIGTPIPNTRCYVVNEALSPQPVGVPGELLIGGPGVTRGYHDRPELTADRFILDPFEADGMLYRTGDLVRWRADGVIEFLGRTDHQVKIRGHRIELGEIETMLDRHATVDAAVVIAREDVPGQKRLVGYVTGAAPASSAELRDHIGAHLPEYMVPAHVVSVDAFPRTPNGKIDRKALPAPGGSATSRGTQPSALTRTARGATIADTGRDTSTPPRGSTEAKVAQVWSEVLALEEPIGRNAEFFALGGDSLALIQAVSRLSEVFGRRMSIAEFVRNPTVAATASLVDTNAGTSAADHPDDDGADDDGTAVATRPMTAADLNPVLALHMTHFPQWRISKLGLPYLREAYRWFIDAHPELAIVAEHHGRIVGFTVGTIGAYKGRMLNATWRAAVTGVLRNPGAVLRPSDDDGPDPTDPRATDPVLANNRIMAVDDSAQGAGFALILAFEDAAAGLGTEAFFHDDASH